MAVPTDDEPEAPSNVVGGAPLALVCASLFYGLSSGCAFRGAAFVVELLALVVAGGNLALSLRSRVYERRNGSLAGYRHVSGVPMIGTLLVVLGMLIGFGSVAPAVLGLVAVGADTGGSGWFLIATWRDTSLWDEPRRR